MELGNLGAVNEDGLDFSGSYETDIQQIHVLGGVDGTYVLSLKTRFTPDGAEVSTLNTPLNPVNLKLRGHLEVGYERVQFDTFLNYTNSYTETATTPYQNIGSYLTVDLSIAYKAGVSDGPLRNSTLMFGVINVGNQGPPRLYAASTSNSESEAINYDAANASPLGRFVYMSLTKRW